MLVKFVKAGKSKHGFFFIENGEKKWGTLVDTDKFTSKQKIEFVKKALKENDEIQIEYNTDDKSNISVTTISKVGAKKSEDSGAPAPTSNKYDKSYGGTEKSVSIERQCAARATGDALIALQGRVDPNTVVDLIESIYNKFIAKIQKK